MTTACIVFLPPPSIRLNFQRFHLLSLPLSKYIFAILAVTRIMDKNTNESTREYSFIHKTGSWRFSGIQCRGRALGLRWTTEQFVRYRKPHNENVYICTSDKAIQK